MPPKAKFTRDEVIHAALRIVRTDGPDALTARSLGAALGSSARPVFTVFPSMEDVFHAVTASARQVYTDDITAALSRQDIPAFQAVGMQYIRFAQTEPKLFQMLFMSEQPEQPGVGSVLPVIDDNYPQILASAQNHYNLSSGQAEWLYRHLWIYSHGIAVLCATRMCTFSTDEIAAMLTDVCRALLHRLSGGS